DTQGLHWADLAPEEDDGEQRAVIAPQLVTLSMWNRSDVEPLRQGAGGLWLRKQDLRYAETLLGQDDCPWRN
ncbi:MAG: hypothetical protein RR100_21705, partial [Comamonas sp.]